MNPRNSAGQPRVFAIRSDRGLVVKGGNFFEARSAAGLGEQVVVSYDEGTTWHDLGRSPVSKDERRR